MTEQAILNYDEVKAGDALIADGGFTCLAENERVVVGADRDGRLFVPCRCGHHLLDGQRGFDNPDELVGFFRAASQ